jgi:hypothetical protein
MTTDPNMGFTYPVDHGDLDVWGAVVNAALAVIGAHDHAPGNGTQVPSDGIDIDANLPFNTFAATGLLAVEFMPTATSTVSGFAGAFFINSADSNLYYRNTSGTNIQVTNGATLNVAAFTGGIGGDYSSVGALFSFDDATDSYWAQQQLVLGVRAWAGLRVGNVDIYQQAASITNRVRLNSPAALAASYALTLPAALGGSTLALQISSAGVMSLSNTFASKVTSTDFAFSTAQAWNQGGSRWQDPNGTHTKLLTAAGAQSGWTIAASTNVLTMPLDVREGDTITNYAVYVNKGQTANAISARLWARRDSTVGTETAQTAGVSLAAATTGYLTLAETGLTVTVTAGWQYYLIFTPGNSVAPAADQLFSVVLAGTRA